LNIFLAENKNQKEKSTKSQIKQKKEEEQNDLKTKMK